jgi:hypothetical protein
MTDAHIPEVLPVDPMSLWCPFCKSEPGKDCTTTSGFAVVHLARVEAAAAMDAASTLKR